MTTNCVECDRPLAYNRKYRANFDGRCGHCSRRAKAILRTIQAMIPVPPAAGANRKHLALLRASGGRF